MKTVGSSGLLGWLNPWARIRELEEEVEALECRSIMVNEILWDLTGQPTDVLLWQKLEADRPHGIRLTNVTDLGSEADTEERLHDTFSKMDKGLKGGIDSMVISEEQYAYFKANPDDLPPDVSISRVPGRIVAVRWPKKEANDGV